MGMTFRDARERLPELLARCGIAASPDGESLHVAPVIGHTNVVFKVESGGQRLACKFRRTAPSIPSTRTEWLATQISRGCGIGAEPIWCDPANGIIVTRWIDGASACTATDLSDPRRQAEAFELLGRFHRAGDRIPRNLEPAATIAGALANHEWRDLPSGPHLAGVWSAAVQLADDGGRRVPSHGDPSPQNFLRSADRMFLIDWEYAAMAPPLWDFAYLAFEIGLTEEETIAAVRRVDPILRAEIPVLAATMFCAGLLNALWFAQRKAGRARNEARWCRLAGLADRLSSSL